MSSKKKKQYFAAYTIIFIVISLSIIFIFRMGDKSFVWGKDGEAQHFPVLVYIQGYIIDVFKNLIHGRFNFPLIDFSIGQGMDVITTLNYYGFGDPLDLLVVLCPKDNIEVIYSVLIFIRLYLSGLFFSCFCMNRGHIRRVSILTGAISYVFCGYALYASVRHPFFVNGMIYLPLYLWGVDRIIKKRKYGLFIVSVCLSMTSNFYFGYMNSIMMAIYVILRLRTDKDKIKKIIKMIMAYMCGIAMSAAIMLPIVFAYLSCSRGGEGGYSGSMFVYSLSYYRKFFKAYFIPVTTIGEWTNLTFCIICPIAVIMLFVIRFENAKYKRLQRNLQIGYIVLTLMMLIPFAGKVMNGFGYVSNRWNYAYAALNAYIVVFMLEPVLKKIVSIIEKNKNKLHIKINLSDSRRPVIISSMVICILVAFAIMTNIIITYSNKENYYLGEFDNVDEALDVISDDSISGMLNYADIKDNIAKGSKGGEFARTETTWNIGNHSLVNGYYGNNWYFSIIPNTFFKYYDGFKLNSLDRTYSLRGQDSRTILNEVTATKYYATAYRNDGLVPYGYSLKKTINTSDDTSNCYVYENEMPLSVGYVNEKWIDESLYEKMTPIQKQEILIQAAVLPDDADVSVDKSSESDVMLQSSSEICKISSMSGVSWSNNQLTVSEKNATLTLSFSGKTNCETYLYVKDFQVINCGTQYQTATVESNGSINHFVVMNPEKSSWYNEPDRTINLGYCEKLRNSCTITFPEKGIYSLDKLSVIYEPMDNYETWVNKLKRSQLKNVKTATNQISGDIKVKRKGILQLSIPYAEGWKAYIDGKETKIINSNIMYMALEIDKGEHSVVLKYVTPYLKEGIAISVAGIIVFIILLVYENKRKLNIEQS